MKKLKKFLCCLLTLTLCLVMEPAFSVNTKAEEIKNVNLSITFNENTINQDVEKLITKSGGQVINEFPEIGAIEVKCDEELIPQILECSRINSVSPALDIKLPSEKMVALNESSTEAARSEDLYNEYQWDIKEVTNNGESYKLGTGNHNVVVGIVDTGVDVNHPDLKANLLGGENFIPKDYKGDATETGDKNDIQDRNGHGSHVAGTIAGNGRIMGVAPNIGFKSYRVFGSSGHTDSSIIVSAIIQAVKDKVNVINLSVGGYDLKGKCFWKDPKTGKVKNMGSDIADIEMYKRAVKYATDNNVVVVAAAGNEALNCADKNKVTDYINKTEDDKSFSYVGLGYELPGTTKGVITVSATSPKDKLASYSNYGAGFIDVTAPGGDLFNADESDYYDLCLSSYLGGHYIFMDGTSMAAPKVSAVAALAVCKYGNIGAKEIAKKIFKSSTTLQDGPGEELYGNGLVNAYNLLSRRK